MSDSRYSVTEINGETVYYCKECNPEANAFGAVWSFDSYAGRFLNSHDDIHAWRDSKAA